MHTHPLYQRHIEDWRQMRDTYAGQRMVKSRTTLYLPATPSHILDGFGKGANSVGDKAYKDYIERARYHNFLKEAVQMAVGMMHSQPPKIELPKAMEGIRSSRNEDIPQLLRRINSEQILMGRIGLMADIDKKTSMPVISTYSAERIINWDTGSGDFSSDNLDFVILDETDNVLTDNFQWDIQVKHRYLIMKNGKYVQGQFDDDDYDETTLKSPQRYGKTLNEIPFVILNSVDISSVPDDSVLLDLSNLCLTMYRADADYRQNLFMQGQDTFVTIGASLDEDDPVRVGSGARIDIPLGGDAKYVGVSGEGLSEQREDLQNLEARAGTMGAQTLDSTSRERESGDSMRQRVAARTADLNQIADSGALALERILKICAFWMNENPDEVKVEANKEFGESQLTGQTMVEMATARSLGFPISARSLHDLARSRKITKRTFEEEIEAAESEGEDFVFSVPETADQAGAEQNQTGDDTDDEASARKKVGG